MAIKDRLIQFILRGKDEMSPEARKSAEALKKVRDESESLREELDRAKSAQGLIQSFKNTSSAADRAQIAVERAEKKAAELRAELDKAPGSKGLATSLRATEREAARAGRELDKLTIETRNAEQAARAAGLDTKKLAEEERRLAQDVDRAKAAVGSNNKELRELERKHRAAARATAEHKSRVDATRGAMTSAGKTVLGYAAAYVSLASAQRLVRTGFAWVRDGIAAMLSEGSESEQVLAQLNAALTATGHAAGFSAEQLLTQAEQLREMSKFTTEQIVEGQTRLLSYTGVVGEQFPAAMQIVIDQAQRLGISVEQSAEIVGQALESPSKAMAALGRQGFTMEKSQQVLLKRLEATGKMAEAQAIIMNMLTESYGGAAAAAKVGTIEGLWKSLKDQVSDFLGMVSGSGAFDYVKNKLQEWGDTITQLKDDGRLQQLAEALSNAFVQGAEKVEGFIKSLAKVDFDTLIDDSSKWLNGFGDKIDDVTMRLQLFWAPFRTLLNGVTSGFSVLGYTIASVADGAMQAIQGVAMAVPDMLGGNKLRAATIKARTALFGIREGFVKQIEQDGADIRAAWDITAYYAAGSQERIAAAATKASGEVRDKWDDAVDEAIAKQAELEQAILASVLSGKATINDMAQALQLIETAKSVKEYEKLRTKLLQTYQEGRISQEEFAQSLNLINGELKNLSEEADESARNINDIVAAMADFADVQKTIKGAQTDVDISKIRSAITRMYEDGTLTAKEYNKALVELEKQQTKLRDSTDKQAGSQASLATEMQKVTDALKEQAAAADQAAQERANQVAVNQTAFSSFADEVLNAARGPLAELSEKALAAFDSIRDISSADMAIDTSGIEATRASLERLQESLGHTQRELDDNLRGPWGKWASEQIWQSGQIQKQYLNQKLALQELLDRYEKGTSTLAGFREQAYSMRNSMDLLNESDLSQLDSAIASAEQRMRALGDSSRSTLDSLRDELDKLRGNEEAIERRRMQSRQRELQAQIAEARAAGNDGAVRDLQQALGMLRTIQSETAFAREQAEREKRREPTQAAAPGTTAPPATTQPAAPATVIRLESARGSGVDVSVPTGQEDALLSILEQSGLRTI